MGRLIDEDMLMERLGFLNTPQEREENAGQIITLEDFDSIPTAYDVDKVAKELKCDRCESCSLLEVCAGSKWCGECHNKIVEIVKHGGVSGDVCEWKGKEKEFIQNPHTKRLYSNEPSMKNIYCITCGKKIKVVE